MPLLIAEPGSARAASLWDNADRAVSVRLLYPETRAALAQAQRLGRITTRHLRDAVTDFDSVFIDCVGTTQSTSQLPIESATRTS